MQCAVLKYFPDVQVTYAFKNRTPEKKLSRQAFRWLQIQINSLLFQPCARKPLTVRQSWETLLSQTTNCAFSKQLAPT
jgi:nicotinate phosphoribosyltransferase